MTKADHERIVEALTARAVYAERQSDEWRTLYLAAIAPPPAPVPAPVQERQPNVVLDAIRELAQGDQRMMQYLHARKRELRKENPRISDDLLVIELSKWETSDSLLDQPAEQPA